MLDIRPNPANRGVIERTSLAANRAREGWRKGAYLFGKEFTRVLQSEIKKNTGKTGAIYLYKGRRIRAGAEGQYPANRSGSLRRSAGFNVVGTEALKVGLGADYAGYLEKGTSKMKARPALKLTNSKLTTKAEQMIGQSIFRELTQ